MRVLLALLIAGAAGAQEGRWSPEYFGSGVLRGDLVNDLPGGREDLERLQLQADFGARFFPGEQWELGAAVRLLADTESNADNVRNLDNEESDAVELSELYLRFTPTPDDILEVGRGPLPLRLTPMVWDADLRPQGASYQHDFAIGAFDRLSLVGGYFAPRHIDENESRLGAVSARYLWREGAPRSAGVALSYLEFDELDEVIADGRTRTNRRTISGALASDFEILDLIIEARLQALDRPLVFTLDLAKNLGADADDEAARLSAVWGQARRGGWELGLAVQRIQRDAVAAAFNDDDWWFPTATRGYRPWVAYGFDEHWFLRLSAFVERRDDLDEHLERFLLDLVWEY